MKGNMFLGYARGSVGDVTFARQKGQQVARARNRQPANPRTINQTMQRSLFANAVKFHSKGVQQLFKFAFEDKKPNESDYNAFMRHNISSSVHISKYASESEVYPAIGKWMMSNGSLRPANVKLQSESSNALWSMSAPSSNSNMKTRGDLSKVLKNDFGLMEGDIVTFVHIIAAGATKSNFPSISPSSQLTGASWYLDQMMVEEGSSTRLASYVVMEDGKVIFNHSDEQTDDYVQGLAVIFSRPTASKLLVSTSYLVGNSTFNYCYDMAQAPTFIEQVLVSWRTQEKAILQGSILETGVSIKSIVRSTTPTLPSDASVINANLTRDNFFADVQAGEIVGFVEANGNRYDLAVVQAGSSIAFAVPDIQLSATGMRNEGDKIVFNNEGGNTITKIVVFDI